MFEKSAERKLKCGYKLRSSACNRARARGSEVTQFYWAARGVHKSEIIRNRQYMYYNRIQVRVADELKKAGKFVRKASVRDLRRDRYDRSQSQAPQLTSLATTFATLQLTFPIGNLPLPLCRSLV